MHNTKVPSWSTTRPLRQRAWARIGSGTIAAAVPDNTALASQFGGA